MSIRILLVDDHAVIRTGLATLLNAEPDMEVVGEASNGFDAINKTLDLNPDVVVMDVTMPGTDGLEATRQIVEKRANVRVLVLTIHDERRYLHQFLRAGASGYFVKHAEPAELVTAVRAVARGEMALHESMLGHLVAPALDPRTDECCSHEKLTDREKQVMDMLVHGYRNQEIAEHLVVSRKTVETHRANIFAKLHIHTRAELVRFAIQNGLLRSDHS